MLTDVVSTAAFWGFLGALAGAGPRTCLAVYSDRARGVSYAPALIEGAFALFTGTVVAHAFTARALAAMGWTAADFAGGAFVCGIVANPAVEFLVKRAKLGAKALEVLSGADKP